MNLSLFLFLIGILGFILNRKNIILMIIAIEIMLLAVTLLVLISSFSFDDNVGQTFSIYIISIAGAESVIGLSILVAYYRSKLINIISIFNRLFIKFIDELEIINKKQIISEKGIIIKQSNNKLFLAQSKLINYQFMQVYKFNHDNKNISTKIVNIKTKGKTIKICSKSLQLIVPNNKIKSLVIYKSLQGYTLGLRLSQYSLNTIFITKIQLETIIGIMLGDAHIKKMSLNGNPTIQFNQGFLHLEYVLFLFQILAPLCVHYPSLVKRADGSFYLQLNTRCLASLNHIFDLFIINKVKTIPKNISNYLTARSLAY
jgi:NADH-ubiquinone oxidoreductase chain 4L